MQLCILACDCHNADSFTSGLGVDSDADRWQHGLDMIYRFYKCGIISAWGGPGRENPAGFSWDDYIGILSSADPITGDADDYVRWKYWDLCLTDFGHNLVEKFGLQKQPFAKENEFSLFIENLFIENGVAWSDKPLIPIPKLISQIKQNKSM